MVASKAAMTESPGAVVREMSEYIEALADEGDWVEVEDMLVRLRGALLNVPEDERRDLVIVAQQITDNVAAKAEQAREGLAGRLSTLKRGRRARTAYGDG